MTATVHVGDYLTDSLELWRVLNLVPEPSGAPALVLENCRTGEIIVCEPHDQDALDEVTPRRERLLVSA